MLEIISYILLAVFAVVFIVTNVKNVKKGVKFNYPSAVFLGIFVVYTLLISTNVISDSKAEPTNLLDNLVNKSYEQVLNYATSNNIKLDISYENSDNIEKGYIISQSINAGENLEDIKNLEIIISDGPNYYKEVTISNMIGMNADDILKIIKDNHLNNVIVDFVYDENTLKDLLISQSIDGTIKRNDELKLVFSLGVEADIIPIKIKDLKNMSLFEATFYLKRNGIKYETTYEFNSDIKKGNVIKQSIEKDKTVNPLTDIINLTVSKGKEIIIPDFISMKNEDITKFIVSNGLKLKYIEEYHESIEKGKIIKVNFEKDQIVESSEVIEITISKGPIKMQTFTSVTQFKAWADELKINYTTVSEYSTTVGTGQIIKFSIEKDTIIKKDTKIVVYISKGKSVKVPNFINLNDEDALNQCRNAGLKCYTSVGSYDGKKEGTVTSQSIKSGSTVTGGTSIKLTTSKGSASSFTFALQPQWIGGSYESTKKTLQKELASIYPGVTFNIIAKEHNSISPGGYHPESPSKTGIKVTQGKTYPIFLVK